MIKVNTKKNTEIIIVEDDFASLVDIKDGVMKFEFSYSFVKSNLINSNSFKIRITVNTRDVSLKQDINKFKTIDTTSERSINDYMKLTSTLKDKTNSQKKYVIAQTNSDPTSAISNEFVQNEEIGAKTLVTTFKMKSASVLKGENVNVMIPGGTTSETDLTLNPNKNEQELIFSMLAKGKDASEILSCKPLSFSSSSAFDKFLQMSGKKSQDQCSNEKELQIKFCNPPTRSSNMSDDVDENTIAFVVEAVEQNVAEKTSIIYIDENKLFVDGSWMGTLIVFFDLIDKSQNVIETVKKNIDISTHVTTFNIPINPPFMKVSTTGIVSEHANIGIRQIDKKAGSIRLYKRNVTKTPGLYGSYVFVGEYNLNLGSQTIISVPRPTTGYALYRAISVSHDKIMSFDYTNVVLLSKNNSKLECPVIVSTQVKNGIQIEIFNISQNVVAIRINKKNNTLHDRLFKIASPTIRTSKSQTIIWTDNEVDTDNLYEYNCTLIYRTGDHITSGYTSIEYIDTKMSGFVDVSISDFSINNPLKTQETSELEGLNSTDMNVTFNIVTEITNKSSDNLKKLIEENGLSDLYKDEILNERDTLKEVLAFNVKRLNLTTGDVDDFGTITDTLFDENLMRKNIQIQPVSLGNSYRYVVTPMIMHPETMFVQFEKTSIDTYTKKSYKFKPSKFFHPMSLKRGTLTNEISQKKFHAKDSISFGALGASASNDLSLSKTISTIKSVSVKKFDRKTVLVQWESESGDDILDAFFVMREINGYREFVGKVHVESGVKHKFYHHYTSDDFGAVVYIIIPILNDFSRGQEARTNMIVLG